jgi:hypothetical protein
MIKRLLLGLLAALLLLVLALLVNTFRQGSRQLQVPALPPLAIERGCPRSRSSASACWELIKPGKSNGNLTAIKDF